MQASPLYWVLVVLTLAATLFFLAFLVNSLLLNAPFVPTKQKGLAALKQALNLKAGDVLFDLGCGNARVLKYCLKYSSGVQGVGVEGNFWPYWLAKFNVRGLPIRLIRGNILNVDLSSATHIYMYLYPGIIEQMLPKIQRECRPGTKIVLCHFAFKNWAPDQLIYFGEKASQRDNPAYQLRVYTV